MPSRFMFSEHSRTRMAQRGLAEADVEFVVANGCCHQTAGAECYFLRRKDVPRDRDRSRLIGATVLLSSHNPGVVITVYRNRGALKKMRCKTKYRQKLSESLRWPLVE